MTLVDRIFAGLADATLRRPLLGLVIAVVVAALAGSRIPELGVSTHATAWSPPTTPTRRGWCVLPALRHPRQALASVVADGKLGGSIECFASPAEAFASAAKLAGENYRILVFVSFYTVAAVMRAMKNRS